jgi:hypothetical protein
LAQQTPVTANLSATDAPASAFTQYSSQTQRAEQGAAVGVGVSQREGEEERLDVFVMSEVPANYVQCLIPALEGLLPEPHNEILLSLCFALATWHAYAKLRMHNASSIQCFKNVTTDLGTRVRHFQRTTCEFYET